MEFKDNTQFTQNLFNSDPGVLVFISDFNDSVTLENLWNFFNDFRSKIVQINMNKSKKPLDIYQLNSFNATVQFKDLPSASDAIRRLNLRKLNGRTVRVMWHDNNHSSRYNSLGNLFIKNVPEYVSPRDFYEYFLQFGEIVSAKLSEDDEGKHYGYGYVHYLNAESANNAVQYSDGKEVWKGSVLEVKNFMKKNERGYEVNRNVYVKNFPQEFSEDEIKELFSAYGPMSFCKVLVDSSTKKKFAIISFEDEESVNNAIANANGKKIGDNSLYVVSLMKKQDRQRFLTNSNAENNFKLSNNLRYCNLHIRNIPFIVKEDELYNNFVQFGEIRSVKIAKMILVTKEKNETKEIETSKGFGYVCFINPESAKYAIEKMNNGFLKRHETWKRPLIIEYFMPRRERLQHLKQNQTGSNYSESASNRNLNNLVFNSQIAFPQQQNFPQHQTYQSNYQQVYQQQPIFQQQMFPQSSLQQQTNIYSPPQNIYSQPPMPGMPNINLIQPNYQQPMNNFNQQQFQQPNFKNQQPYQQVHGSKRQPVPQQQHPSFNQMNQILQQETLSSKPNNQNIINQKVSEDEPDLNYLFSLDDDFAKKDYLGEFIFRKIEKHPLTEKKHMTIDAIGKITGMILGIEDIKEITETCRNNQLLTNRIIEAIELMESNN